AQPAVPALDERPGVAEGRLPDLYAGAVTEQPARQRGGEIEGGAVVHAVGPLVLPAVHQLCSLSSCSMSAWAASPSRSLSKAQGQFGRPRSALCLPLGWVTLPGGWAMVRPPSGWACGALAPPSLPG